MIAYLINLKRANDRLLSAKESFDKAGINFNLEVAVDGKDLSLPHKNYSEVKYNLLHGKRTNFGELGCYLSHLNVLKKFLNTAEDWALVCEDDIEFHDDIVVIINNALDSGIYFDFLRLSGGSNRDKEIGLPLKLKKIHNEFFLSLNFGFKSLKEVIDHYCDHIEISKTTALFLHKKINLSKNERIELVSFLHTLNDTSFIFNKKHHYPN